MSSDNSVEVIVATHKVYDFPNSDIYRPVHVGKALNKVSFGIEGDDSGENISHKNTNFCELTALYYAWKNPDKFNSKYIGLVHYRRYFSGKELKFKKQTILGESEVTNLLSKFDCILPKPRNYVIESIRSHYNHSHNIKDLNEVERIINEFYPNYNESFDKICNGKKLHLYNMFIMKKEDFDNYCAWLFDILFKLEEIIDISDYNNYQSRVFGFLSERLFNVWIDSNNMNPKFIKVCNIEGENLVDKGINLLQRKYFKRYNHK